MDSSMYAGVRLPLLNAEIGLHSQRMSQSVRTDTEMTRHVAEMINLAQRYCALIDASGPEDSSWLRQVSEVLPRLQAAIVSLDGHRLVGDAYLTPDLDARFELYGHLRDLLGERDGYWLEYDSIDDAQPMTGSLADDLTDIYCELKHGLRLVDQQPERAVKGWLDGFELHWRQHLTDAQRHLSMLASQGRLEP